VLGLFAQELAETAVVGISRDTDSEGFYTRTYHLRRQNDVPPAFLPLPEPSPAPVPSTPALAEASFA
jgi:hypothetical protein